MKLGKASKIWRLELEVSVFLALFTQGLEALRD